MNEKKIMRELNIPESDIPQIERAAAKTRYKTENGKRISRQEARALLGEKEFFSGLARSAFHWTAARETKDGKKIYFDSSAFFKE